MKGIVNVPGKGKTVTLETLNAQEKLTGTAGQYVGFDEEGNAVAVEAPSGGGGGSGGDYQEKLTGAEGQYVGFDAEGNAVALDAPQKSFFGTIGTTWTEDEETGVKYQTVAIDGVLASHVASNLDVVNKHERTTEGYAAYVEEKNQFLTYITNGDAETVDGGVKFYIYGDANTVEIPFGMVVA